MPLHEAVKYVAAAYIVAFALILIYLAIMAARLRRVERDLSELLDGELRRGSSEPGQSGAGGGGEEEPWPDAQAETSGTQGGEGFQESGEGTETLGGSEPLDVGRPQSRIA